MMLRTTVLRKKVNYIEGMTDEIIPKQIPMCIKETSGQLKVLCRWSKYMKSKKLCYL